MSAPTDNDAMDTPRAPDTEMSEVEPGLVLQRGLRFAGFQIAFTSHPEAGELHHYTQALGTPAATFLGTASTQSTVSGGYGDAQSSAAEDDVEMDDGSSGAHAATFAGRTLTPTQRRRELRRRAAVQRRMMRLNRSSSPVSPTPSPRLGSSPTGSGVTPALSLSKPPEITQPESAVGPSTQNAQRPLPDRPSLAEGWQMMSQARKNTLRRKLTRRRRLLESRAESERRGTLDGLPVGEQERLRALISRNTEEDLRANLPVPPSVPSTSAPLNQASFEDWQRAFLQGKHRSGVSEQESRVSEDMTNHLATQASETATETAGPSLLTMGGSAALDVVARKLKDMQLSGDAMEE